MKIIFLFKKKTLKSSKNTYKKYQFKVSPTKKQLIWSNWMIAKQQSKLNQFYKHKVLINQLLTC